MQELMQVLGGVVTIAGLVIVAPYEAGRVPPAVWHAITQAGSRVRRWLARFLPFLRRNDTHNVTSMTTIAFAVMGSMYGRTVATHQGTTKQQLAAIRASLTSIHGELDGLRAEDGAIRAESTAKFSQLSEDHAALRRAHEEQRHEQGQVNARGVPLAAVGALLAGIPASWLAAAGWWLAGPLAGVGLVTAAVAARWLWDAQDKLAAGLHSFKAPVPQNAG